MTRAETEHITFPKTKRRKKSSKSKLKLEADKLFSLWVRESGQCKLEGMDHITCSGNLQCMHVVSRRYFIIRWDRINAMPGCQAHHYYYTNNPWEWQELIKDRFPEVYNYVNKKRLQVWDGDIEKILVYIKSKGL